MPENRYSKEIDYISLGVRVRQERKKLHLTQEQLAERIGVTTAFIGHIERAERRLSVESLIRLCNALGVSVDYLFMEIVPSGNDVTLTEIECILQKKSTAQKKAILDILRTLDRYI